MVPSRTRSSLEGVKLEIRTQKVQFNFFSFFKSGCFSGLGGVDDQFFYFYAALLLFIFDQAVVLEKV